MIERAVDNGLELEAQSHVAQRLNAPLLD